MIRFGKKKSFVLSAILLALSLVLGGCGGGGGGGGTTVPEATQITVSGMAVGGAPVIGTVNIKDSSTPVKTSYSAINSDGSYTLNITDAWQSPFLLWVDGHVNNQHVMMLSCFEVASQDQAVTANITPLTTAIVASAMGDEVDNITPETASIPDQSTVESIKQHVQEALEDVFAVFALDSSFDLFETPIDELGAGSDQMFDVLDFSTNDNNDIVVASKEDDTDGVSIDQEGKITGVIDDFIATTTDSQSDLEQIQEILELWFALYETSRPDEPTLVSQLLPKMAEGYLNSGRTRDESITLWADVETSGISAGAESYVSCSIFRAMKSQPYGTRSIHEIPDSYSEGLWVNVISTENGTSSTWLTSFVKTGDSAWQWYGNRKPFSSGGLRASSYKTLYSAGVTTYDTGLWIYFNDRENLALNNMGITNIAIFNPVMPAEEIDSENTNCLKMARENDGLSTRYRITNVYGDKHTFCAKTNGGLNLDALASQDTKEFVFIGLDDSDNPISAWVFLIGEAPLPVSELEANDDEYFPMITGPDYFSEINFEGANVFQWQLPANGNLFPSWSSFSWDDEDWNWQEIFIENPYSYAPGDLWSWLTESFDPSSMAGIVRQANFSTTLLNKTKQRRYTFRKSYRPWVEEFVSISGGELIFDVDHTYAAENLSDRMDVRAKIRDVNVTRLEATVTIESASKTGESVDVRTEMKLSYQPDEYWSESGNEKDYFEVKIRILYENDEKLHLGGGPWGSSSEDGVEYEMPDPIGDFPFWEEIGTTQSHIYAVEYDERTDSLKIEYDGYVSTFDMSAIEAFDPADFKEARIRTRIRDIELEGDNGQMKVRIDNVKVNGQPYDDFNDGFENNKWDVNATE